MLERVHNTDVLSCISSLRSDEVFTPPKIVNKLLNQLPDEIWKNEKIKFLDPVSKSGVFLREITKRLIIGLEHKIPNLEKRINHILKNQLYGISISELTSLISKRSLYFTKKANNNNSIVKFDNPDGNIKFFKLSHSWQKDTGKCKYCGVNKVYYQRDEGYETYAFSFIHNDKPENFFNMKFDVIIGNPPYQMNDGGGTGDSAKPIYNLFVEQAKKLNPTFLSMIIPSRWMKGGKGLEKFRENMIADTRLKYIYDFENAKECFKDINLDGGVCYFLWDKNYEGKTKYIFKPHEGKEIESKRYLKSDFTDNIIRDPRQISIIEKISNKKTNPFSNIVSTRKPYGISTDLFNDPKKYGYKEIPKKEFKNSYKIYGVFGNKGGAKRRVGFIDKNKASNCSSIKNYKLFHSYAYTTTATVPPEIIIGSPNEICTETFLRIGNFETKKKALNCLSYIKTKFFRGLLSFNRIQKNLSRTTFDLIPLEDFEKDWSDKELYKKYNLNSTEIDFIENKIKKMD
mgnify:CR=1 FL=1|tara:strand:+ start:1339 stop:2880 length:1542 start_codon:yes stop_codon:yes gene_type:complete